MSAGIQVARSAAVLKNDKDGVEKLTPVRKYFQEIVNRVVE
jgi:hypothetical protein